MKKALVLGIVLVILISGTGFAFDGARKGFVLGGGLGFTPYAKWSLDDSPFDEDKAGIGVNVVIGYAWDEANMIVYETNAVGFQSDISVLGDRQQISQGFFGAAWYHYFGPTGKSFFTVAGLGLYIFDVEDFDANDPGGAFLGGMGYEFTPHFQAGVYFSVGKTSEAGGFDYSHGQISLMVTGIAF